ncbi:hypothetical protein ACG97_13295 [Vogesella sp. EB]|nr:hypothetical protein ACG97_13295 [Vogesella sp. EB]
MSMLISVILRETDLAQGGMVQQKTRAPCRLLPGLLYVRNRGAAVRGATRKKRKLRLRVW